MSLGLQTKEPFPPDTSFTLELIGGKVDTVFLANAQGNKLALDGTEPIVSIQRLLRASEDWRE